MSQLLNLLQVVLKDTGEERSKGDVAFYCPFCNHRKRKLEIQVDPTQQDFQKYHCWVCDTKGSSIYHLFTKLKVDTPYMEELKKLNICKTKNRIQQDDEQSYVSLPSSYVFLGDYTVDNIAYRAPLNYLKNRNIKKIDIYRYSIGYCLSGKYSECLIFPSYDIYGHLNFFVAKNIYTGVYINCDADKDNIIFNEILLNYNLPLYICEGIFDALSLRNLNATILLGKTLSTRLKCSLVENKVKDIYLVLDPDAIKTSYRIAEEINKLGINVHITKLKDGDPNEIGYNRVLEAINTQSVKYDFKEKLLNKLSKI